VIRISNKKFEELVAEAIAAVPAPYSGGLQNVAFIVEDQPSAVQSKRLKLSCNALLFGLYEGVPLPRRNGATKLLPDKITLFKRPLCLVSNDESELRKNIHHTVWHEVAHYYGLDHKRIHELEHR